MDLEQIKQEIADRTGLTTDLLKGETVEETIAQAKALLAYKREYEARRPKSAKEQFADFLCDLQGIEPPDEAGAALEEIAERARVEAGGYPGVHDGGNPYINGKETPDPRPAREQFAEWAADMLAFDPRDSGGGKW